jgi:hypothetical protein
MGGNEDEVHAPERYTFADILGAEGLKGWQRRQIEQNEQHVALMAALGQLVSHLGGILNAGNATPASDVMYQGTVVIDNADGYAHAGFKQNYQAVALANLSTTEAIVVQNSGPQSAGFPPARGSGLVTVPAGSFRCFSLRGTEISFYAPQGTTFDVVIYARPRPPVAGSVSATGGGSVFEEIGQFEVGTGPGTSTLLDVTGDPGWVMTSHGVGELPSWEPNSATELQGTFVDAATPTDGDVLTVVGGIWEALPPSAGPLAYVHYAPASTSNYGGPGAGVMGIADAVNLITPVFDVPASGTVLVRLSAYAAFNDSGGRGMAWGVFLGAVRVGDCALVTPTSAPASGHGGAFSTVLLVTGLTPGASIQLAWGIGGPGGNDMIVGNGDFGFFDNAPATMEVWPG